MQCRMEFNGTPHRGKALLETNEIIFRGDVRLKIARAAITEVRAEAGQLRSVFDEGSAVFDLGDAAPKWAKKILNPPSRLEKLGIKEGTRFTSIGAIDPDFLREVDQAGRSRTRTPKSSCWRLPTNRRCGNSPPCGERPFGSSIPKACNRLPRTRCCWQDGRPACLTSKSPASPARLPRLNSYRLVRRSKAD